MCFNDSSIVLYNVALLCGIMVEFLWGIMVALLLCSCQMSRVGETVKLDMEHEEDGSESDSGSPVDQVTSAVEREVEDEVGDEDEVRSHTSTSSPRGAVRKFFQRLGRRLRRC